jgi:hypothetical protein
MAIGEEGLSDEGLLTARKIHQAGAPVVVEQFEGMPHCFGLIMTGAPAGKLFFQGWSEFCRDAVFGNLDEKRPGVGHVTFIHYGLQSTTQIPLNDIHEFSDLDVEKRIHESMTRRIAGEKALVEEWQVKAKL